MRILYYYWLFLSFYLFFKLTAAAAEQSRLETASKPRGNKTKAQLKKVVFISFFLCLCALICSSLKIVAITLF